MLSKRDLGVGYLLGTGLGLLVSLAGYLLLVEGAIVNSVIGVASAGVLASSLLFVGYWLRRSELSAEVVWRVAQYSSVGLSIPVIAGVLITVVQVRPPLAYLFPSLFINTIASGAVIGLLLGTVRELRREHRTATKLNQRNRVLNRVLRHNLRNDMSVILGYLDVLREGTGPRESEAYQVIRDRVDEIMSLSEAARRIEEVEDADATGPMDLAELVTRRAELYEQSYEDVTIDLEVPDRAPAAVGPLFASVIDNLLENAIEHADPSPTVGIAVGRVRGNGGEVTIAVSDDGPGIPPEEIEALEGPTESPLHHGSGLGLWLVKWVTESYGGEVHFERSCPEGSTVVVEVPAPSPMDRIVGPA